MFYLGLVYQTCITWLATNGRSEHVEPWYVQCIFPCIWMLTFLGFSRTGTIGAALALTTVLVSAWIGAATYLLKLIPLYSGYSGRATLSAIAHWWSHPKVELISATALGPLSALCTALCAFIILWIAPNVRILGELRRSA